MRKLRGKWVEIIRNSGKIMLKILYEPCPELSWLQSMMSSYVFIIFNDVPVHDGRDTLGCATLWKCASFWKKSGWREVLQIFLIVWFWCCCCARKCLRFFAPVEEAGLKCWYVHRRTVTNLGIMNGMRLRFNALFIPVVRQKLKVSLKEVDLLTSELHGPLWPQICCLTVSKTKIHNIASSVLKETSSLIWDPNAFK